MALSPGSTLADYIVPTRTSHSARLLRDALLVIGCSIVTALSAHARIDLPFTPVPLTLQTFVVMLVGAALGSRRGAMVMLLYLAEGAVGLPVFSRGGGAIYLFGPTAGYLWSYPIAAYAVGLASEHKLDRSWLTSVLAMLPASLIILGMGTLWLALVTHLSLSQAFVEGMLPFIPGDLLKIAIAATLLPAAWKFVRHK